MVVRGSTRNADDPFPTMARITTLRLNDGEDLATGVFVSPNILLTAAHVLHSPDLSSVVTELAVSTHNPTTGSSTFFEEFEDLDLNSAMEKRFRIHPGYSAGKNDIAAFRVDGEVAHSAAILTTATLDEGGLSEAFAGVSGWGLSIQGSRIDKPSRAQFASQFIAATAADVKLQKSSFYQPQTDMPKLVDVLEGELFFASNISDNLRQGACPGDSGAGVFLGVPEAAVSDPSLAPPSHLLLGLVSHSSLAPPPKNASNADRLNHYSRTDLSVACTNLLKFREWIEKAIGELDGKPATFK